MSKELPYFRFTVSEWMNDDISLESYEVKGFFVDVCSYYWFKDCSTTLALLEKRFTSARKLLEYLIEIDILKHDPTTDEIVISFLNNQFALLGKQRKNKQEAGKIGGKRKASNARILLKQKPSYKDKDKDNNKDKYKEDIHFPDRLKESQEAVEEEVYPESVKELIFDICQHLNIQHPEINNGHGLPYRQVKSFVQNIFTLGNFESLTQQFKYYKQVRKGKFVHNLLNFIGTHELQYEDGAWNECDWKLKALPQPETSNRWI